MADLLPSSSGPDDGPDAPDDRDPRVIGLDSDEADELLAAISSSTARSVLSNLHESPATATDLSNKVDTSLQNVQYHLGNLEEAGLIEVVDMRYSEKGREMNVFGPADRALVVVAGRSDETTGLKSALSQLIGGVGVLGIGAAVINRLAESGNIFPFVATSGASEESGGAASGDGTYQVSTGGNETATDAATTATQTPTATPSPTTAAETVAESSGDGGYSIAEATTTSEATQAVTEEAVEATRTMTEQAATATPTPTPEATQQATDTAMALTSGAPGIGETIASLSPGLLFFLGGVTVLCLWIGLGLVRN
ncbi:ArsR/SmtB family transcription factor [Haloferax sp. DFSO60]|uniref:ArsR/SmtB family transcription factor n=1 Tax=Haloferax sp. DFSO60 TaxID=3388652 RepID=UPI003979F37F